MAGKGATKLKLLYIKDYLERYSDETNPVGGEELLRLENTGKVTDVDLCGNTLAVLSGGLLSAYDCPTGAKVNVCEVGLDAVNVELFSAQDAYVLSLTQIKKISIS